MKKVYIFLLLILICLSVGLFYANLKTPIRIALVGNFEEERYNFVTSSIIAGRVAESDINNSQGIRGRNVELSTKSDDFKDPEATIKYLIKNKIEAIITTASSEDLLRLKPYLDKSKIVCMSVGATSSTLGSQDDYIYRVLPDDSKEVATLFNYLDRNNLNKDFVVIYSGSNVEYKNSINENIRRLNGKISFEESWGDYSLNYSPKDIEAFRGKNILILASARDSAFVVQKLSQVGLFDNIFGLSWSGDKNLIYYGGKSIENFKFISPVGLSEVSGEYGKLTQELQDYNKDNGLIPYGVYEAFAILKKGYEDKYEKHLTLKQAIDENSNFLNNESKFKFDKYGDSEGDEYIFTVNNAQFVKLGGSNNASAKN